MIEGHGSDWSSREIDVVVADYFAMRSLELSGQSFNKAQRNEALQSLISRSRKAIEFKHCNISAVVERLGMPIVRGYKPLPHFQNALIEGVERYLVVSNHPISELDESSVLCSTVNESPALWIGPPPAILPSDLEHTERLRQLIKKFDPAERDARNRKLGKTGEEFVLRHEEQRLIGNGRPDLARKIEWTSEVRGDGAGYDIRSFEMDGKERLIEVKTTNGSAKTPFFLSENERRFSDERKDVFCLLRLYSILEKPSAFELRAPLTNCLALNPVSYRASLI